MTNPTLKALEEALKQNAVFLEAERKHLEFMVQQNQPKAFIADQEQRLSGLKTTDAALRVLIDKHEDVEGSKETETIYADVPRVHSDIVGGMWKNTGGVKHPQQNLVKFHRADTHIKEIERRLDEQDNT